MTQGNAVGPRLSSTFHRLWFATGLSALGNGIQRSLVPLLAAAASRDPKIVGVIVACARLPWLVFGFHVGAWIDKYSPSRVIRVGVGVRVVGALLLTAFLLAGWSSTIMLCGLVFAVAVGEVMGDISAQTWVAHLETSAAYPVANARIYGTQVLLGQLTGPVFAGLLFSAATFLATGACAILQVLSAIALRRVARSDAMTVPGSSPRRPDRSGRAPGAAAIVAAIPLRSAHELIWKDQCLTGLVLLGALSMLVYGMWITMIVLFATDPKGLDLSPSRYGVLMMTMACGSLLGALVMPMVLRATNGFACVAASCLGVSVLPLGAALSTNVFAVGFSMFAYGLLLSAWNVSAVSFRQTRVPIQMLGRVNALYRVASWGAMPIGAVVAGLLGAGTTAQFVFVVCVAVSLLQYPTLRLVRDMKDYRG